MLLCTIFSPAPLHFYRDFMDLLLSPASKVLNNWFEVGVIYPLPCFSIMPRSQVVLCNPSNSC